MAVAISRTVAEGNGTQYGGLALDLAPNYAGPDGQDRWKPDSQSPIYEVIRHIYGQKAYRCEEPWDVCPSAHFNMGGVAIDEWGRSSVPGLFAAGEAAGGVHGGNRLGSAALAEIFIFGRRAGLTAATWAKQQAKPAEDDAWYVEEAGQLGRQWESRTGPQPVQLVRRLQQTMWRRVGLVRSEADCEEGLREIERIGHDAHQIAIGEGARYNLERLDALELKAMLLTAESILRSAQSRRESRGAHFRLDYPDRNAEAGKSNVFCTLRNGRVKTYLRPVGSWTAGGWSDK